MKRISLLLRWVEWLILSTLMVLSLFLKIRVSLWISIPLFVISAACLAYAQIIDAQRKRGGKE